MSGHNDVPRCQCGDALAMGHWFCKTVQGGKFRGSLKCGRCGMLFSEHQAEPEECPNPKLNKIDRITPEEGEMIMGMRRGGMSYRAIGDVLERCDVTVAKYYRSHARQSA